MADSHFVAPIADGGGVRGVLQDRWLERTLMLSGVQAVRSHRNIRTIDSLADVEVCVFSQFGEDGILDWLLSQIPPLPPLFIEFGVGNYVESNTRFLLKHRNWRGLVLDGDGPAINSVRADIIYAMQDLEAVHAFITVENITSIIKAAGFGAPLGVLSVDVDGNDYWILRELLWLKPAVIICEYNAVFGDLHPIAIPYQPSFDRSTVRDAARLYYGASIQAFISLLEDYALAGTNTAGNNAFFVRKDLYTDLIGRIADTYPRPSLFRESYGPNGELSFIGGPHRSAQIKSQPVTNISTGDTRSIESLGKLYSDRWLAAMGRS
ncbi:MAG: hypothetical protein ACLPKB_14170 [Xanthobacteraceae bacterium]